MVMRCFALLASQNAGLCRLFAFGGQSSLRVSAFSTPMASVKGDNRLYSSSDDSNEGDFSSEERIVGDMLHRIRMTNRMPQEVQSNLITFKLDGVNVGKVSYGSGKPMCFFKRFMDAVCLFENFL